MTENKKNQFEKSPVGASFLAMIPSMGHFYVGNMMKGIAYAVIFLFLLMMIIKGKGDEVAFFAIALGGFYVFQIIDAYNEARKTSGRSIEISETTQEEEESSLFMGVIVLILGVIFQLSMLNLINFSDISKFWPLILLGVGGKMIYSYMKNNREKKDEINDNNGGTNE